jgi:hypothetical protein
MITSVHPGRIGPATSVPPPGYRRLLAAVLFRCRATSTHASDGSLAPGGTVEGNVTFEVPEGDSGLSLLYKTNAFSGQTITVKPL